MNRKQLETQKAELEKKLQPIKEQERREQNDKFKTLLKLCKPEIDEYMSLGTFRSKGKVKVELSYELEVEIQMDSFVEDDFIFGNCYVTSKEPKGHNVALFMGDTSFGNVGIDGFSKLARISPEAKEYADKFKKARKALISKVEKSARKLGLDEQQCFEEIADVVCR